MQTNWRFKLNFKLKSQSDVEILDATSFWRARFWIDSVDGREGETILSFTRVPRANPEAQVGSLSPLKLMEY
jgi:hypothetical protein